MSDFFNNKGEAQMPAAIERVANEYIFNPLSNTFLGHSAEMVPDDRPIDINDPSTYSPQFKTHDPTKDGGGYLNPLNWLNMGSDALRHWGD